MTIKQLITDYAKVYAAFESLQKEGVLPGGDQKTGVIGEYYAKCYADTLDQNNNSAYAKSGDVHDLFYIDKSSRHIYNEHKPSEIPVHLAEEWLDTRFSGNSHLFDSPNRDLGMTNFVRYEVDWTSLILPYGC